MKAKQEIKSERRKHPRIPIKLRVKYRSAKDFFEDYSGNISAGGMFIRTREPVEYGTKVLLEFVLPEIPMTVRGLGEVVRVVREGVSQEEPGGMGIKFLKFDAGSEESIKKFISRQAPGTELGVILGKKKS